MYEALKDTSLGGRLPHQLLLHLPEWCCYIETPGLIYLNREVFGLFVHLDHDANHGHSKLRFLLNLGELFFPPLVLHLVGTLEEGIEAVLNESKTAYRSSFLSIESPGMDFDAVKGVLKETLTTLVNLTLQLCAEEPDILGRYGRPGNPPFSFKRNGTGMKEYPVPQEIRTWTVDERMGSALRKALKRQAERQARRIRGCLLEPVWPRISAKPIGTCIGLERAARFQWSIGCHPSV